LPVMRRLSSPAQRSSSTVGGPQANNHPLYAHLSLRST
jgi:hypothetical protein